ncbi:MAG: Crp/Fnr family transcriptional regulator [Alkalispirochaeta sp.]|jgi:CRP/FNR family transcriptional regulator
MNDFLTGLSKKSLAKLETAESTRIVPSGGILFLEGQEGTEIFRLLSGTVRLFRTTPDGREVTIRLVEPGELFAEIVLFEQHTYPVSAAAPEQSRLAVIQRRRIITLLEDPEFRDEFLREIMGKLRFLSQQLYVLTTMDVRQRLIRFLEVRYGRRPTIESELNKQETAAAISVRPETLSRTLASLQSEDLLTWKGRRITVSPQLWAEGQK